MGHSSWQPASAQAAVAVTVASTGGGFGVAATLPTRQLRYLGANDAVRLALQQQFGYYDRFAETEHRTRVPDSVLHVGERLAGGSQGKPGECQAGTEVWSQVDASGAATGNVVKTWKVVVGEGGAISDDEVNAFTSHVQEADNLQAAERCTANLPRLSRLTPHFVALALVDDDGPRLALVMSRMPGVSMRRVLREMGERTQATMPEVATCMEEVRERGEREGRIDGRKEREKAGEG